jgi:hypothetical protein
VHRDNGRVNLSTLRLLSLKLLQEHPTRQTLRSKLPISLHMERKRAGLNDASLAKAVGLWRVLALFVLDSDLHA